MSTRVNQLKEIIYQLDTNIVSVKEIYKNRLKAVPTAYLVLSLKKDDLEIRTRKDIDKDLINFTKEYLCNEFSPVFITSQTTSQNYKIVQDIIRGTEASRAESFESDPTFYMTEEGQFYALQKYRVFPEYVKIRENKITKDGKKVKRIAVING